MNDRSRLKAIRVTLTFGSHSDAALVRALRSQRPYARAKLLRTLIREGLHSRLRDLGFSGGAATPRPVATPHSQKQQGMPSSQSEPLDISVWAEETEQDGFSESALDQLGKTVQ